MAEPETDEEIDRCLDALAAEYTNTAKRDPRRLCPRRYMLPKFMERPRQESRMTQNSIKVRDHALLQYHRSPIWPPTWNQLDVVHGKRATGE